MLIAVLCEQYGWTYREYMDTPQWFLDLIKRKYVVDAKRQERASKKP